jgi:hypothetical protein
MVVWVESSLGNIRESPLQHRTGDLLGLGGV